MLSITSALTRCLSGWPSDARAASMRVWRPSTTTSRPSTSTCRTSRAEPRTRPSRARAPAPQPASRTASSETVTRSARAPGSIRPASGQPRQACPPSEAARSSAAAAWCPRSPLARRSSSSTARASSNMSITAWESLPSESEAPASTSGRIRPMPSARSRSVVGTDAAARARAAEQAHVAVVEVGGVNGGEARLERAGIGEQRGRGAPVRLQAGLVLGRLLGDVSVQRTVPLAAPTPRRSPPPRDRPRACCGSPRRSAPIRSPRVRPRVPPTPPRCRPRSAAAPPPAARRSRRAGSSSRSG